MLEADPSAEVEMPGRMAAHLPCRGPLLCAPRQTCRDFWTVTKQLKDPSVCNSRCFP